MYIFALALFYMIALTFSVENKPKFCVNCRYFIQNTEGLKAEYGKCSKFPYENSKFLVDGIIRNADYYSCSSARSWEKLCGKDAVKYKKKYVRKQPFEKVVPNQVLKKVE